jgi:NAD(P)-dependent dehydrogenase (short-subunit alcohol dehydrogenase family)
VVFCKAHYSAEKETDVPIELDGRVALVTGAAQGLGLTIAQHLQVLGARVGLVDIKEDALAQASEEMGGAATFAVDLSDAEQVAALMDRVVEQLGRVDILVNNAGVRSIHAFVEHPLEQWRQALDVNLTAPFLLSQAAVPHMLEAGKGKIVNITSVAAELAFKNRSAYNVSKAGLAMLTKSIALELGAQGICCNAVAPGVVETPLNTAYFLDKEFADLVVDATPAGHWGQPADVAAAVAFLCSDAADFVNGATLLVDGGWSTGKGY